MKIYNLAPGLIISVFIALIAVIPSVIRFDTDENSRLMIRNAVLTFLIAVTCWIANQTILHTDHIRGAMLKTVLALTACSAVSIVILYPLRDIRNVSLPLMNFNGLPYNFSRGHVFQSF